MFNFQIFIYSNQIKKEKYYFVVLIYLLFIIIYYFLNYYNKVPYLYCVFDNNNSNLS